jgi:electron transport complex protein RnfE
MAGSTLFVLLMANIVTSLIRGLLRPHLRILVFTITISAFVTVVDRLLAAYLFKMSQELGPYIALIIVNCIIISRCEICSAKQGLWPATTDAIGMGLGFTLGLCSIAVVRELLGAGGFIFGEGLAFTVPEWLWPRWGVMALPPGAFFTFGLLLALVNWWDARRKRRAAGGG